MKRKGFTLLEVLLGLTIFAVIAVSLYSTFSSALQLQKRAQTVNRIYRESNWSLGRLSLDLENMRSYDFTDSYPDKTAFTGQADRISLVSATEKGFKVVSYYVATPEDAKVHKVVIGERMKKNKAVTVRSDERELRTALLIREEVDFLDFIENRVDDEARDVEILSTRILENGLKFQYAYEPAEGSKDLQWRSVWKHTYIPAGVRIEMTLLSFDKAAAAVPFTRDVFIPTGAWGVEEK